MNNRKILCVDDEANNVETLERLLRKKYTVLKAMSGQEALNILASHSDISIIISDQKMPQMTGVDFLEKSLVTHPKTIRILLTGYTDLESIISAINKGQIYRYITKPWEPNDLLNTIDHAVERYNIGIELEEKNHSLKIANEQLESLDKAKSNFMILINHELKTPLTTLINFSDLLKQTKLDEDQNKYLNRIHQSTDRLRKLIDDTLLIVRADTETLKLNKLSQKFTLNEAVLSEEMKKTIETKKITLNFDWTDQNCLLDNNLIKEVFIRLIHNALKFSSESTEVLIGSILQTESSKNGIEFYVQNQGPQISEKIINKIYNPFFIDEDILNHSVGLGLGLSICQGILKSHESELKIQNTPLGVRISFILK